VPEGRIITQDPEAFTEVNRGTAVDVVVSTGPSIVIVPSVTCRSVESATAELESLGLQVQVGSDSPPNVECPGDPELVARQEPAPGTQADPGSVVVLHQGIASSPSPTESPSPTP
jgi:serine/threonine-protein kinase